MYILHRCQLRFTLLDYSVTIETITLSGRRFQAKLVWLQSEGDKRQDEKARQSTSDTDTPKSIQAFTFYSLFISKHAGLCYISQACKRDFRGGYRISEMGGLDTVERLSAAQLCSCTRRFSTVYEIYILNLYKRK